MTSDRAAVLARIMRADESELDNIVSGATRRPELVIELAGDFDLIRLVKS
jgi:hypothetical protein